MNHIVGRALEQRDYRAIHLARHLLPFEDHKFLQPEHVRVIVRGQGLYVWDDHGRRLLDGMSGLWCTTLGYGRQELVAAATRQMTTLSYCSQFFNTAHPTLAELSARLFELLPAHYSRILYCNSGSEANEILIKVVRRYWELAGRAGKRVIIGRHNGYHGSTVGSASLGGMKMMHALGASMLPEVQHIEQPFWFGYDGPLNEAEFGLHAAQALERKIIELGADNVAAFVAEPFQGAGGMIFPPDNYWPEIQRICQRHEVLLCADEVIGGFGRTGHWFAHEYFGFQPDLLTIAKGLTSGYVPMGGLVLSERVGETLAECGGLFAHGLTYQGHPVAAAVALATLSLLDEGGVLARLATCTGPYLQAQLRSRLGAHVLVNEIQGTGAVAALQLALGKDGKQRFANENAVGLYCMRRAQHHGLIVRNSGARIILAPALVASLAELDELIDKLTLALDDTARALQMA
ncbi:aminotransferase [Herbaspirillum rubrisubalbicans]|uniref:aminotransferase n=1 Tax=Herbaspirillum rubrisubalbicans TaxID=80842 RepID=UPI0015589ADB|nr:aminotransferase [Herbaspirillum rubrisubalbicans]NQE47041.1 aminotransferase [Herbaspirillum rubrisubalbicans]